MSACILIMLSAYLYHINHNQLQPLTREEFLAMPSPKERASKRVEDDASTLRDGPSYCREGEFIWVEINAAEADDYEVLRSRYNLSEGMIERLQEKKERPKVYDYGEYSHLVFYAVTWPEEQNDADRIQFQLQKIDCVVGTDYIVTIHEAPIPAFEELRARWELYPRLMKSGVPYLLYELIDAVLDGYFPMLETLDEKIDHIENRLFENSHSGDRRVSAEIFALKRDLLQIRHVAGPMRDVVNSLLRHDAESGREFFPYFQSLYDHSTRIIEMTDTFRDVLGSALDAFLAAESNRMNAVMKTLTSASIILLVPNLIAAIYGMNFDHMPEIHTRFGYPITLGLMFFIMLALYANFKRKDWL